MALNAGGAWLRSRWLGLPFVEQGLVLPRGIFAALGGFDTTLAHGEDHDLVWRARRGGLRLRPLRAPLYTSARRYAACGWLRTTTEHLAMTAQQAWRFSRPAARP
jgi:GT2 family glycosyltransferase